MQQLDELVNAFEDRVQKALDKHASERTKEITIRSTYPWFTSKVKDKKRAARRRKKIWHKYNFQNIGEHFKWQEKNTKPY